MSDLIGVKDVPEVLRSIGITPGKKYRPAELRRLITQAKADQLKIQGYVLRVDLEGFIEIIHYTQADDWSSAMRDEWRRGKIVKGPRGDREMLTAPGRQPRPEDYENPVDAGTLPPIRKRTPQERLESLLGRWVEDCKRHGFVPGLDDPMVSAILGVAWEAGRDEITAEGVRAVARHFLERAEREKEARDSKRTVRPSPNS